MPIALTGGWQLSNDAAHQVVAECDYQVVGGVRTLPANHDLMIVNAGATGLSSLLVETGRSRTNSRAAKAALARQCPFRQVRRGFTPQIMATAIWETCPLLTASILYRTVLIQLSRRSVGKHMGRQFCASAYN
ncbi:MAG TPA: hypothetical protein VJU84_18155 [Pyrinomonadaceae bacterium]|nr:hypothetical protein [Pyrinomonadaceae bacterium]